MDDFMMKEAVFVFLHGPKAYPQGAWEPIVLEVLHEVGFDAGVLEYTDELHHPQVAQAAFGFYADSKKIPFGVIVTRATNSDYHNSDAEQWLNDIAFWISGLRFGSMIRVERTPEEARVHFRGMTAILNSGGSVDAHAEDREAIVRDPKSYSEYEAMRQNPPEGFEAFEAFFTKALAELEKRIRDSKPLEPILLTEENDYFVQISPPGLTGKHLRDDMKLETIVGMHQVCGGEIRFIKTTTTRTAVVCDRCHFRITIPSSVFSVLWQLRERGNLLRSR